MERRSSAQPDAQPRLPQRGLSLYIDQILSNHQKHDSELERIAMNDFQAFLTEQIEADTAENDGNKTTNELFKAISERDQKSALILLNALIDIDFADETAKIKGILNAVIGFVPDSDPELYDLLESILLYLTRFHRTSMQIVLHPIRDKIWKINSFDLSSDQKTVISSFYLLNLLLKRFPFCLEALTPHIAKVILFYIQSPNPAVQKLVVKVFKTALNVNDGSFQLDIAAIQQRLNNQFASVRQKACEGAVMAAEIMVKKYPELITKFQFDVIPLELLVARDQEMLLSGFSVIPFVLRANPGLFTDDRYQMYFGKMSQLIVKNAPCRNKALLSVGRLIFNEHYSFKLSGTVLDNCLKAVRDFLDCQEAVYAYLALLTYDKKVFFANSEVVFKLHLSPLLIRAFCSIVANDRDYRKFIVRNALVMVNNILLHVGSQPSDYTLAFKCLRKLQIGPESVSPALALRYSIHLFDDDLAVRREATSFLLECQVACPTPELTQQLISSVSTEKDEELRVMVIQKLRKDGSDLFLAPSLQTLLRDMNSQIRIESFQFLISMLKSCEIREFVNSFFSEKIRDLEQCTTVSREQIECFLVGSRYAMNKSNECALEAYGLIFPVSSFLSRRLLSQKQPLFSSAIELLSYVIRIVPSEEIDMDGLVNHMKSSLTIHGSRKKLTAALLLFMAAMRVTNLRETIYDEHRCLISQILELANLHASDIPFDLLLEALSVIGAIRPAILKHIREEMNQDSKRREIVSTNIFINQSNSSEPLVALLYASIGTVISSVLDILANDTLVALHSLALDTLMQVLNTYREINATLEQELIERLHILFRSDSNATISVILTSLTILLTVLGQTFEPLVADVVGIVCGKWNEMDKMLLLKMTTLLLRFLPDSVRPHLLRLSTVFVSGIDSYSKTIVSNVFSTYEIMEVAVSTVDYVVYPALLSWVVANARETELCCDALGQLRNILIFGGTVKFQTQIIRSMLQLVINNPSLQDVVCSILVVVAVQVGKTVLLYAPHIRQTISLTEQMPLEICFHAMESELEIPSQIVRQTRLEPTPRIVKSKRTSANLLASAVGNPVNAMLPIDAFDESQWISWSEEFYNSVLRQTSSRALSLSTALADRHPVFKDVIIPIAIAINYVDQRAQFMEKMKVILQVVFSAQNVPKVVIRTFLAVIEILELLGVQHPIKDSKISEKAMSAELLPQALRAVEGMFTNPDDSITRMLIVINQELGLPLAAAGVLHCAQEKGVATNSIEMNERLGEWQTALKCYSESLEKYSWNKEFKMGKMRCLQSLSKYSDLNMESDGYPRFQAIARWHLLDFEGFKQVAAALDPNDKETMFYQVLCKVLSDCPQEAQAMINKMREEASDLVFPVIAHDYGRIYKEFSQMAILTDVEEVMRYKQLQTDFMSADAFQVNLIKRETNQLVSAWRVKFDKLPDDPIVLYEHLCVQSLVLNGSDLHDQWTRLFDTAFNRKAVNLIETALKFVKEIPDAELKVVEARLMWARGEHEKAASDLCRLITTLPKDDKSLPNMHLRAGWWLLSLQKLKEAKQHVRIALGSLSNSAEAWKCWSQINLALSNSTNDKSCLVDAFDASVNGLILSADQNALPFSLPVLSILLRRGCSEVNAIFSRRMNDVPSSVWIDVLPQILARLNAKEEGLLTIIQNLLFTVGSHHPHVILYALMVPLKSEDAVRRKSATEILDKLKGRFPRLASTFDAFVNEVIRISATWWEIWQKRLEEASKAYAVRRNMKEMLAIIQPLAIQLSQSPSTFLEVSFSRQFGYELTSAVESTALYQRTHDVSHLSAAWKVFSGVFQNLGPVIHEMHEIPMKYASPFLAKLTNSPICVPGTYVPNSNVITITEVCQSLEIVDSRQRPRKFWLTGSDGEKYSFLLRAHEDTRLDERVMQLFSFVNTLIGQSDLPLKHRLALTTFKVVPLTTQVGLIGWVQQCSTIMKIVTEFRTKQKKEVREEEAFCMGKTNNRYLELATRERLTVFEQAINATEANEIEKFLLTYSADSAHWLERRTNYATSLASTSMIGYVIGLGNRHPQNIMMKQKTGDLVHIDFSQCFEMTMHRKKFPETVPFRLTRMLINALEVSGIEGTFRKSCKNVMKLMRRNSNEILGIMEVFVYDPLLQWIDASSENTAESVVARIGDKLKGQDFAQTERINATEQVDMLIKSATSHEHLAEMWGGWFPWW